VSRNGPKENYLIDGRNRLEAVTIDTGNGDDEEDRRELIETLLDGSPTNLLRPVQLYGGDDPYAYVVSANVRRRHLTAEKKREIVETLLKTNPERSDRATAEIAGVGHPFVAKTRRDLEKGGQVESGSTRIGADGKSQPATKPPQKQKPQPPARDPLNDFKTIDRQVDALMAAWNRAGPEAREEFLRRIDKPLADNIVALRA
jgi:hypothetical protein